MRPYLLYNNDMKPITRKCRYCGKEYTGNFQQRFCEGPHYATCIICGRSFEINRSLQAYKNNPNANVCSGECRKVAKENRLNKSI